MEIKINEQITLTEFRQTDISKLVEYLNDPIVYQFTRHIPSPYTLVDAENWIKITVENKEKHGVITNWAIRHSEHGLIGGIGQMMSPNREKHADEIGYWLAKPMRGQRIMSEVISVFTQYLIENRELTRVWALVYSENIASKRSLQKAGFEVEGFLRKIVLKDGQWLDAWLLARVF